MFAAGEGMVKEGVLPLSGKRKPWDGLELPGTVFQFTVGLVEKKFVAVCVLNMC